MLSVWKRELQSYFFTAMGYTFLGFFLLIGGYFFWGYNINSGTSDMSNFFSQVIYMFTFASPMLTMKLMSDDRRNKTDQLLITSPISINAIILGKFFAAMTVMAIGLVLTFIYPVIIAVYGKLSIGTLVTNYIGFFLIGCVYISIGLLISTMFENAFAVGIITLLANILIQVLEGVPNMLSSGSYFAWIGALFSWLSLQARNADFAAGLLSFSNILYYISFAGVILFIASRIVERRRWSEA